MTKNKLENTEPLKTQLKQLRLNAFMALILSIFALTLTAVQYFNNISVALYYLSGALLITSYYLMFIRMQKLLARAYPGGGMSLASSTGCA